MKRTLVVATLVCLAMITGARGQSKAVGAPTGQKSLSATMNVYVFPNAGQAPDAQSKDEGECYTWAVSNTGTDPFELSKQLDQSKKEAEKTKQQADAAGKGAGAKGAVGGAAAGALIGAIAGDTGKGAAIGAGVGLIGGRRGAKHGEKKADQQADAQVEQAKKTTAAAMDNFKKAFSVCLEAKKYMVKY